MFDIQKILHIAKLARLGISEQEAEKFAGQLTSILDYVAVLDEVDTKDVVPSAQVTGLQNVQRKDEVRTDVNSADLLACSPFPIEQNQVQVPNVIPS